MGVGENAPKITVFFYGTEKSFELGSQSWRCESGEKEEKKEEVLHL